MFCIIIANRKSNKKTVYFLSKIATMKSIIYNNHQTNLFYYFESSGEIKYLSINYRKLLKLITKDGKCMEGYRKCGIMDTLGNILCIDELFECPMNKIIIDLISKNSTYLNNKYKAVSFNNITYNYNLYYSTNYTNSNITVSLKRGEKIPKYITINNFVLDTKAYIDQYGEIGTYGLNLEEPFSNRSQTSLADIAKEMSGDDNSDNIGSIFSTLLAVVSYRSNKKFEAFMSYVEEKLKTENKNDDIYYEYIGEDIYIKNYIGFRSIEDIDKFMNYDFDIYKDIFPKTAAIIMSSFFLSVDFFCFIGALSLWYQTSGKKDEIHEYKKTINEINQQANKSQNDKSINPLANKPKDDEEKKANFLSNLNEAKKLYCLLICLNIALHILFVGCNLGFLIYSSNKYIKVKEEEFKQLKSIISDEFVTNFIYEFISLMKEDKLLLNTIIVLSIAIGLDIMGVIILLI